MPIINPRDRLILIYRDLGLDKNLSLAAKGLALLIASVEDGGDASFLSSEEYKGEIQE